jgi:hypothetical protein
MAEKCEYSTASRAAAESSMHLRGIGPLQIQLLEMHQIITCSTLSMGDPAVKMKTERCPSRRWEVGE